MKKETVLMLKEKEEMTHIPVTNNKFVSDSATSHVLYNKLLRNEIQGVYSIESMNCEEFLQAAADRHPEGYDKPTTDELRNIAFLHEDQCNSIRAGIQDKNVFPMLVVDNVFSRVDGLHRACILEETFGADYRFPVMIIDHMTIGE